MQIANSSNFAIGAHSGSRGSGPYDESFQDAAFRDLLKELSVSQTGASEVAAPPSAMPPNEDGYARWLRMVKEGTFISDNRPDNVWGTLTLNDGQVVTIFNGGSVESQDALNVDLPSEVGCEVERALTILAAYGGTLEIVDTAKSTPEEIATDMSNWLADAFSIPSLSAKLSTGVDQSLVPDAMLDLRSMDQA